MTTKIEKHMQKLRNRNMTMMEDLVTPCVRLLPIMLNRRKLPTYGIHVSTYEDDDFMPLSTNVTLIRQIYCFGDYNGWVYRMDTGNDDKPKNVTTAIDAYYYTNWRTFNDLVDQKAVPQVYIYYQIASTTLTFAWSYEFNDDDEYTQTFSLAEGSDVYDTAVYGTGTYAKQGGAVKRRDLPEGRGRSVRFKFANSTSGETFRVDGLGMFPHLETNV